MIKRNHVLLLLTLMVPSGLPAQTTDLSVERLADDKVDFEFLKECKSDAVEHNLKCDHEWALRNGNSLNYIQEKYVQEVLERFEKGGDEYERDVAGNYVYDKHGDPIKGNTRIKYSAADYTKLKASGICTEYDDVAGDKGHTVALSFAQCHSRWKREALKLSVFTRNETLENNKARVEMISDKDSPFAAQKFSDQQNQKEPQKTVLDDFFNLSKKDVKKVKNPKVKRMFKLVTVDEIKFDKNPLPAPDGKIRKSKMVHSGLEQSGKIEIEGEVQDDGLAGSLLELVNPKKNPVKNEPGKNAFSGRKYYEDEQKKKLKVEEKLKKKDSKIEVTVTDDNGNVTSSISVLQKVMEDVQGDAQKSANGGKRSPANKLGSGGAHKLYATPQVNNKEFKGIKEKENLDISIINQLNNSSDPVE